MLDHSTIEKLRGMNLTAFAAELERQMSDSSFSQITFEERLGLLVDSEWNRRRNNKLNRLIKKAAFSAPNATVEGIEYIEDRHLDKKQILRFAACNYIDEGHHIILKGASGNGKTYLACALGNAACRKFKSVRYIRTPELLDELSIAKVIIPHSGKHESAGRKTSIRGEENADSRKERSNSPKERTSCKIMQRRTLEFTRRRP